MLYIHNVCIENAFQRTQQELFNFAAAFNPVRDDEQFF